MRIPLADESAQCIVTSPPYWGLRDYSLNGRGIGLEPTLAEYIENMRAVGRELWRRFVCQDLSAEYLELERERIGAITEGMRLF